MVSYDVAVHSDHLIHWTGKDIDVKHEPNWYEDHRSLPTREVTDLYLRRLNDIVTYGLWMTAGETRFINGSHTIEIPDTPRCCFTELKLSESRRHAQLYGRLGIGVKRPFLFNRFGRPMVYFGFGAHNHRDKLVQTCLNDLHDKKFVHFFKPMNSTAHELNYDYFSESEWRILYFEELVKQQVIIDPRDSSNTKEHAYFLSLSQDDQQTLRYLIPLDGWFSMIIYPSLEVKNPTQWGKGLGAGVKDEIKKIKTKSDHGNRVEKGRWQSEIEGNWPIEVDLDACRHF